MTTKAYYESPLEDLIKAVQTARRDNLLGAIQALSDHLETFYYHECRECTGRGVWNDDWRQDPQMEKGCKVCDESSVCFSEQ